MKKSSTFYIYFIAYVAIFLISENVFADVEEAKSQFYAGKYREAYSKFEQHKDNPEAMYYMGVMLMNERYGIQNQKEGIEQLKQSAEGNFPKAQLYLGYLYETGKGLPKDLNEAIHWYKRSADSGNARAQFNLALIYRNAKGVKRDDKIALELFESASDCYLPAKNNLAYMLQVGLGTEKDITRAIKLYTEAANANFGEAQYNLAIAYLTGDGVEQNFVEAYKWFELAAHNLEQKENALKRKDLLSELMEPEEIEKAKELVKKFVPTQASKCSNK